MDKRCKPLKVAVGETGSKQVRTEVHVFQSRFSESPQVYYLDGSADSAEISLRPEPSVEISCNRHVPSMQPVSFSSNDARAAQAEGSRQPKRGVPSKNFDPRQKFVLSNESSRHQKKKHQQAARHLSHPMLQMLSLRYLQSDQISKKTNVRR